MAKQIYRHYIEPSETGLVFWDTYTGFWIFPSEIRNGIIYPEKIGISIGRNIKPKIDKEMINRLPKKFSKQIFARYKGETGFFPKRTIADIVRNMLITAAKRVEKILGVGVKYTTPKEIEIFEFIKTENYEEFIPILYGYSMLMGMAAKMKRLNKNRAFELKKKLKRHLDYWFDKGYENHERS